MRPLLVLNFLVFSFAIFVCGTRNIFEYPTDPKTYLALPDLTLAQLKCQLRILHLIGILVRGMTVFIMGFVLYLLLSGGSVFQLMLRAAVEVSPEAKRALDEIFERYRVMKQLKQQERERREARERQG